MKTKIEKVIKTILFLFFFPAVSFAEGDAPTLASIANKILGVIRIFPRLFIAMALAYFLYGVSGYITAGDEKKRKEGRDTIVYGLLGLFVMVSIWGIVDLFVTALGLK